VHRQDSDDSARTGRSSTATVKWRDTTDVEFSMGRTDSGNKTSPDGWYVGHAPFPNIAYMSVCAVRVGTVYPVHRRTSEGLTTMRPAWLALISAGVHRSAFR
jgi:hypothetical protein